MEPLLFLAECLGGHLNEHVFAHEVYRAVVPGDRSMNTMAKTCWGTLGKFVCYLRDAAKVHAVRAEFGGGCDPTKGLAVSPRAGSAVIFYNLLPNSAEKDFTTWHASCDVTSEGAKKYAANLWFHLAKAENVLVNPHEPWQN